LKVSPVFAGFLMILQLMSSIFFPEIGSTSITIVLAEINVTLNELFSKNVSCTFWGFALWA